MKESEISMCVILSVLQQSFVKLMKGGACLLEDPITKGANVVC